MKLNEGFRKFSVMAASALGSSWLFVLNVFLIILWLAAGPIYHYSDTWQLLVNTATTVFTYLAVFLIQNTQNRDAKAVHLKLDELISSVAGARNRLVDLEDLSDEELAELQGEFQRLHKRARENKEDDSRAIHGDVDEALAASANEPGNKRRGEGETG
jgi:low affinity Fe/Cu permease